ncbi:MAG TPA: hypothetical protein VF153_08200 [Candidatus Limnocylindria bacterium]
MIVRLRVHLDSQKDSELARTLAQLGHLSARDHAAVTLLAHRLVNRAYHHLATRLKSVAKAPDADVYLRTLSCRFDEG